MPEVRLTIVMNEAGKIEVEGPLDNKLICYGLLRCAEDVVAQHAAQAQLRRIVPSLAIPGLGRNGG